MALSNGHTPTAVERARCLDVGATADQVKEILSLASLSDRLEIDAVISEISERTKRRYKVATLTQIVRSIKAESIPISGRPDWINQIIIKPSGEPVPIVANVVLALRHDPAWRGVFALNEFNNTPVIRSKPPWANGHWTGRTEPFSEANEARVLVWVQQQGIHCKMEAVREALSIIVDENRFHPIRDYLNSLVWDGINRIDKWLTYYLGVDPIPDYTGPSGARWLISGVARIFEPGCMAKYAIILEGRQDLGKSQALQILGGEWFTDDIDEMGGKDSKMQVGNAWIIELAELDSMRKSDISTIKAFISRKVDKFRKPFGRYVEELPRQSIMAGTVNPAGEYFQDATGAVRFQPHSCASIDLPALLADRDQLWAEAVQQYRRGVPWWLDLDSQTEAAANEQESRFSEDIWTQKITQWLSDNRYRTNGIPLDEIVTQALEMRLSECDKREQTRIGVIVSKAKWSNLRRRSGMVRERICYPPRTGS